LKGAGGRVRWSGPAAARDHQRDEPGQSDGPGPAEPGNRRPISRRSIAASHRYGRHAAVLGVVQQRGEADPEWRL